MRTIHFADSNGRDSHVLFVTVKAPSPPLRVANGKLVTMRRFVAAGEQNTHESLALVYGDDYSAAILDGDPEIDLANRPAAMAAYEALNKQLLTLRPSLVPIIGDVTMDGNVDGADLIALLSFWNKSSVADFNNDAQTNGNDLAIMIGAWSTNTP